jgi:hypothetical protein
VDELRAAKKGELAEKLEAERRAWLARKPGARTRASRPRIRRARTRDERQGEFNFGAREAILGRLDDTEETLYDLAGREISGRQDASAADADESPVEAQEGPGKGGS